MQRLSDVINKVVEEHGARGPINSHEAAKDVIADLGDDEIRHLALAEIAKRIKSVVCKIRDELAEETAGMVQGTLFPGLRDSYAIDVDERLLKRTTDLSLLEFRRIIEIREQQIAADAAHLALLRKAFQELKPFWLADMTFADAEATYRKQAFLPPAPSSAAQPERPAA